MNLSKPTENKGKQQRALQGILPGVLTPTLDSEAVQTPGTTVRVAELGQGAENAPVLGLHCP